MLEPAPIAVFAYRRLAPLLALIESLRRNPEAVASALYIFCDGAKTNDGQEEAVAVRAFSDRVTGFKSVEVIKRVENFGLARSVIAGVTQVIGAHGRVIVLEDDLLVSPYFLGYMNAALMLYADDLQVGSIHGYIFPVGQPLPETFFIRGGDCWGWATWQRAWQQFNPDGQSLLNQLRETGLCRRFDLDGAYPYTRMLRHQVAGRNSSWAIRWHGTLFLKNMLTLYPHQSLVLNAGLDGAGTHCNEDCEMLGVLTERPVVLQRIPVAEDEHARQVIASYLRSWWWRKFLYLLLHPKRAWAMLLSKLKKYR